MLHVAVARFLIRRRRCNTLRTSDSMDDVMLSHNGANRPESKTTRMLHPDRQVAATVGRQTTLFGRVRPVAAPGAKFVVFDCILFDNRYWLFTLIECVDC